MGSASRISSAFRRTPLLVLVLAISGLAVASAFSVPAMAQEQGWSLRDLFFPRRVERVQPPKRVIAPKKTRKTHTQKKPVAAPEAPVVEKASDARTVLVVGDFMASGLADGLETTFADNPKIVVVSKSNGSSGFVRDDFYNWPKEIGPLMETVKPAAVVLMIGSNDRQQMKIGDEREPPRSEAWTKEYEARTEAMGKALAAGKVPFLWVGMPAFKLSSMTSDMLALNEIYRASAEKSGGEFVDIWDGFVDENGAFITTGPDVNGQPVRLRSDDGINMTKAGKRKLAFYTEKPLLKALGLAAPGAAVSTTPAGVPATGPALVPAETDRTPPISLSDPVLDGETDLLGATAPHDGKVVGDTKAVPGSDAAPSPGRADEFAAPATAAAPVKTTSIKP